MTPFVPEGEPMDFLWLDLEFTGLDVESDVVIEAAAVATHGLFDIQGEYSTFIRYPVEQVEYLMQRNPWWLERPDHLESMLQQSMNAKHDLVTVAQKLTEFAEASRRGGPLYLAGNSIHSDRQWVRSDFPDLEAMLHYRMVDVSALKLIVANSTGYVYPKEEKHRAIDDIHESMAELGALLARLRA